MGTLVIMLARKKGHEATHVELDYHSDNIKATHVELDYHSIKHYQFTAQKELYGIPENITWIQ